MSCDFKDFLKELYDPNLDGISPKPSHNEECNDIVQTGFGAVKRRDVEKVSVLTKWRQSSDPSKDSSSGSDRSPYALRKVKLDDSCHSIAMFLVFFYQPECCWIAS